MANCLGTVGPTGPGGTTLTVGVKEDAAVQTLAGSLQLPFPLATERLRKSLGICHHSTSLLLQAVASTAGRYPLGSQHKRFTWRLPASLEADVITLGNYVADPVSGGEYPIRTLRRDQQRSNLTP
jgi:hypothetical protein